PDSAEAVMTDAERTQFIARTPPPPVALRRTDYPPADDDDSKRTGLIWAAVVVALLLVIGVAGYAIVFLGKDEGPKKVAIPTTLIGESQAGADQYIRNAGLVPRKGPDVSGECAGGQKVDKGKVCTVTPAVGMKVSENSIVTYH